MANTGKIAEVMFENMIETYEHQNKLMDLTTVFEPDAADMQNSNNTIWRTVQQHAPILEGWDLTGQEQDIIEETYPLSLGTPRNDFVRQRADNLRDMSFWARRGEQSGKQQADEVNKVLATTMRDQGSLFHRSSDTSGYDFISEGQAIMNERQGMNTNRCYLLNDRDTRKFGTDLAARQTLQGMPDSVWKTGQLGNNIAGFDGVYTGSFLPNLAGGASPDTTITGNQSFKPQAGTVSANGTVVTNVDYRSATIPVAASANYNVGDKINILNTGTAIESVGLSDKTETGQAMTFTVVGKPTGTSLEIFPKPIAADDSALNATEKAYANVDTTIVGGATVLRLNTDANAKTNLFWDKDAVEVVSAPIPAELFSQFAGMKVIPHKMMNGQMMYMIYDANITDMTFRYRIFSWWGVTIKDPQRVGTSVTFTA